MAATMTHLSPKTGKRMPCTAKVRACRFEGHELVEVKPGLESFLAEYTRPTSSNPVIQQALDSDLTYRGPKPSWWAAYTAEAEVHPSLPTTPELLDVVDSSVGKLAVIWQDDSHRSQDLGLALDSGIKVSRCILRSVETGQEFGRLQVEQLNDESVARSFGDDEFTFFRLQESYTSEGYGLHTYPRMEAEGVPHNHIGVTGDELTQLRRQVWRRYHSENRRGYTTAAGEFIGASRLTDEHIPDDATVVRDLKKASKELAKENRWRFSYSGTPHAGFVEVEQPLRGEGLGTTLYVYSARYLARQGKVVRGSDTQTGHGKRMWENLQRYFPGQFKPVKMKFRHMQRTMPTLDFRA